MLTNDAIAVALLLALAADAFVGDPRWLYHRIGHPVQWMGKVIAWADRRFNRESDTPGTRRRNGACFALVLVVLSVLLGWIGQSVLLDLPGGIFWLGLVMSSLVAGRGLRDHVLDVAVALETRGIEAARRSVAQVVGRDPEKLDEAGVARAAIESLAENFSDAVVAPAFWCVLFGLPGLLAYKALNTADSMIGYKSPRHLEFGRGCARLDDAANIIPSRLSGAIILAGACFLAQAKPANGWVAMLRDAPRHRSPNAGWPESAMAGSLGIALAGPRHYQGSPVEDHWMGANGRRDAHAGDIRRALALFDRAWLTTGALIAFIAWSIH